MATANLMGDIPEIPGVISYIKDGSPNYTKKADGTILIGGATPVPSAASSSASSASQSGGGTMGTFQDLLKQRQGLRQESMTLQEQQLQKLNTQKNNTAIQNQYANRDNLVSIMQQLLQSSRRTAGQQARIFM